MSEALSWVSAVIMAIAVVLGIIAFLCYYKETAQKEISPNRWSWLIWSASAAMEALTFNAVSEDYLKVINFAVSALCCVLITVRIWRQSKWELPKLTESLCLAASVLALVLWLFFSLTLWAHILMVVAVPIAFIPTWDDARADPSSERTSAWWLWTLSDFLTIVVILMRYEQASELPYAFVEFACHAMVWQIVRRKA